MQKIILYFVLVLLSSPVWAELEVIRLQHRNAEDVLPVIRPLLEKDGVASGMNNQLILRTSPRNLDEIKRLLPGIDIAPRSLRITIMQNVDSETVQRLSAISGSVGLGRDARLTVANGAGNKGIAVDAGQGADGIRVRVNRTRLSEEDNKTQQVQVVEGGRALIRVGQSAPVQQRQLVQSPWGTRVIESTQYREVNSGFYVRPSISGERVTLEISAQNDTLPSAQGTLADTSAAVRTQQLNTTVSGRLGEWIELGDTSQQTAHDGSTLATRDVSEVRERRHILLKVEQMP